MPLTAYTIITGLTAVTFFLTGSFVFWQNPKIRLYRQCFIFSTAVAMWALGYFFTLTNWLPHEYALAASRISHAIGSFIPITYLHFVLILLHKEPRKWNLRFGYLISAILFVLCFTPLVVYELRPKMGFSQYPEAGVLYIVYSLIFILMPGAAQVQLAKEIFRLKGSEKARLIYFFVACTFGFAGGITLFLLIFDVPFPPNFSVFILLYPPMMAYTILVHHFMDIDVIIKKATIFTGLVAFNITVISIVSIFGKPFFQKVFGWGDIMSTVPSMVIILVTFKPLENWLINVTDRYLFQKGYDESELLNHFRREVLTIIDSITVLVKKTVKGLDDIIHIESVGVVLKDEVSGKYRLIESQGMEKKGMGIEYDDNSAIVSYLKATQDYVQKNSEYKKVIDHKKLSDELSNLGCELCLPFLFEKELYGFIALGPKRSGRNYTQNDISLLMAIASAEAITIFNIKRVKEAKKSEAEYAQNERMLEIGGLTSGINHEIASPLTVMLGQSDLFINSLQGKNVDELKPEEMSRLIRKAEDILRSVHKQSEFISGITTDLSDYAKNKEILMAEVSVSEEIKNSLELVKDQLADVIVEVKIPKGIKHIYAGKQSVRQVFTNVIKNAVQAMDHKGRVTIEAREEGNFIVTSITDNGPGIPEDIQKEIFKPFFTTKRGKGGTGLGLYLTHLLVRRNKGEMAMKSKVGEGTTFFILLQSYVGQKIHHEEAPSKSRKTAPAIKAQSRKAKPRILTVDDQPGLVDMIQMYFEARDYEVDKALDGFRAIELVQKKDYDIILLDYQMPGKEGDQVLKEIKDLKPGQKVAMVTSMAGDEAIRKKLFQLGAEDCINKPLKLEELEEKVRQFIGITVSAGNTQQPSMKVHVPGHFISHESSNGHSKTLLIADDEEGICDLIKMFFESKGYTVFVAHDPEQAVKQAQIHKPHSILLDLKMKTPEDGLTALPLIKEISPNSKIIMSTGNDDEKIMAKARSLGAEDYILKPLVLENLQAIIEMHLETK